MEKHNPIRFLVCVAMLGFTSPGLAGPAPVPLVGKTISINWGEATVARRVSDGFRGTLPHTISVMIYVSSAGRYFAKLSGGNRFAASQAEVDPEKAARGISFSGNTLMAIGASQDLGRRITATFDQNFSSCTAVITVGKAQANARVKGFDGAQWEIIEKVPSAVSCSISEGNKVGSSQR